MSIGELATLTNVANYDSSKSGEKVGYQRNLTEKRGREFGYFISGEENTCIGEIMLNDRDAHAEFIPLSSFIPDAPKHKLSAVCGILRIPADAKFYIYDGQTRRFGYISLLHYELAMREKGENPDFQHMKVPFCIEQANYLEEVSRFLQHNGRAAKVPNTHKAMVVFDANIDYEAITGQTAAEREYSLSAGIIRELNDNRTSPWHRMIKMPDTSVDETKKLITTMASFHTGMKGMLKWMNKQYWSPETTLGDKRNDVCDIATTYWRAVKQVCPKIWGNPDGYVMHLAQGVSSMSILMGNLYRDFFNEDTPWNITNIAEALKKSNILTTPKWWEAGGKISKRGGNYKNLELLAQDMYMQIRKNL
jgi:DGQHR domain-containing protein